MDTQHKKAMKLSVAFGTQQLIGRPLASTNLQVQVVDFRAGEIGGATNVRSGSSADIRFLAAVGPLTATKRISAALV